MKSCINCLSPLTKRWQIEFCSTKCGSAHYAKNRPAVPCPHCGKSFLTRWKQHIGGCLAKMEAKAERARIQQEKRIKERSCLGCGLPFRRNGTFCTVQCYDRNRSLAFSPESREKISQAASERMRVRYSRGWEPTCGRAKKYAHHSPIAGPVKLDGLWELDFAKYLDRMG